MSDKLQTVPETFSLNQSILNKSKTDKFQMVLSLPEALRSKKSSIRSNSNIDFDSLQFTIYGSPVPSITVDAVALPYAGQEVKISSHTRRPYDNVFVDFTIDNLYRNWWVIYSWLDLLNNDRESYYDANDITSSEGYEAMQEYMANFIIYGLDEFNNRVIKFTYEGCFPVSLTSPKYDDTTEDEIKSTFEFAFTFFEATLM